VQSAAFPSIEFDDQGVCNFCRGELGAQTGADFIERGRDMVAELLEAAKSKGSTYDAVLCNSGGKDSSYTLKLATQKYGLRVLSFTLDNGFIAPGAWENIHRVVDALGVDHIVVRPAANVFKPVMRAVTLLPIYPNRSLMRISAGCNACISLVNMTALRLALQGNIPLIIAGFTLGQIPSNGVVYQNNYRFLAESRHEVMSRLREAVGTGIDRLYGIADSVLSGVQAFPHNINLLCLESITEPEIVSEVEKLGWRRPTGVDGCSSNCTLNTFNNYVHESRYGYSPYELELSHLVRKSLMTRAEALEKLADQPLEVVPALIQALGFAAEDIAALDMLANSGNPISSA
jgi:tRNA(Ile)-lysidine synthase TilS/MesJ